MDCVIRHSEGAGHALHQNGMTRTIGVLRDERGIPDALPLLVVSVPAGPTVRLRHRRDSSSLNSQDA